MGYIWQKNVKIIIFDYFSQNQQEALNDLLYFLNIDNKIDFPETIYNTSKVHKNSLFEFFLKSKVLKSFFSSFFPLSFRVKLGSVLLENPVEQKIPHEDVDILKKIYENDVIELEDLLKIDLPWKKYFQ